MTVCIAAIYGKDQGVVAVADKMFTSGAEMPTVHEVNENSKITKLSDKVLIMMAGNINNAATIIKELQANIKPTDSLESIANKAADIYKDEIESALNSQVLSRWGMSREDFMGRQQTLQSDLVEKLNQVISQANLDTELIIAGKDSKGPGIYIINNPGNIVDYTSSGVALIGSGAKHGHLSIVESQYNKNDNCGQVLFESFKAKKRAEFDPNVGKYTSICIANDGIKEFTDDEIKDLYDLYEEADEKSQEIVNNATIKLGEKFDGDSSTKK